MKRIRIYNLLIGIGIIGVFAVLFAVNSFARHLEVTTIAEDDELRKTGVITFAYCGEGNCSPDIKSEHKVIFVLDGELVDPDFVSCGVVQKDVCHPKNLQFDEERFGVTELITVTENFTCKFRPPTNFKDGVGVIDVYFHRPFNANFFIGDHILVIEACVFRDGEEICAKEIKDICILRDGFSADAFIDVDWPGGGYIRYPEDGLDLFRSCKSAALVDRQRHGVPPQECTFF